MIKVTAHGSMWVLNGRKPQCPECKSKSLLGPTLSTDVTGTYAEAEFSCKICECIFTYSRDMTKKNEAKDK